MTQREQLIEKLHAPGRKTLEEVQELRAEAQRWLVAHPDDQEVLGAGESLAIMERWLRPGTALNPITLTGK